MQVTYIHSNKIFDFLFKYIKIASKVIGVLCYNVIEITLRYNLRYRIIVRIVEKVIAFSSLEPFLSHPEVIALSVIKVIALSK
jgi:hypothetical protein